MCCPAGIHQQYMACDHIGERGRQIQNRAGYIVGRSKTFQQVFGQSVSSKFWVGQEFPTQFGFNECRSMARTLVTRFSPALLAQ